MHFETCIIPVGGNGSSMGDLCKDTPKCLLEVGGKSILQHVMDFWNPIAMFKVIVCQPSQYKSLLRFQSCSTSVVAYETRTVNEAILAGLDEAGAHQMFVVALGDCLFDGTFDFSA